jgi:hypothetical protein
MPQAVAKRKQPAAVVAGEWVVVFVEVRNVCKGRRQTVFAFG